MTTVPRRLRALFLFLLFLGGGTSLPGLDAVLFHRNGETSRAVAHVETNSGCASHEGHCGIGCPASAAEALGAQSVTALLDTAAAPLAPRLDTHLASPSSQSLGFHSRAPPAAHV